MYTRLLKLPKSSFFLLGPRGTGKTTWVRHLLPRARVFDLLDESLFQSYLADPSLFSRELNTIRRGSWVVVDEVQRLPALLNEVHRAIVSKGLRFVLTGSSARKLRRGGTNLLGGRALRRLMFPLTPAELGQDFDLERALSVGTLPLVWVHPSPEEALGAYTQLYLKEEIQAEAIVRNLAGFARFLPIAALFHGQVLNASNVARDAAISRPTVDGYLGILEDTLLAYRLPAFEGRLRVRERRHPKLYWIDPGLVRSLKHARGPVTSEERGPLLEGYVLMALKAHGSVRGLPPDIYYWSPAEARLTEVDFLVVRGETKIALEVKASVKLREEHFRGLRAIRDLTGLKRRILVYLGGASQKTSDGIEVWPIDRFWRALAARGGPGL
jgi:uncharacterized protein